MALDVEATRVTGRWLRHAYPGADPLARRDPPPDNRWQRGYVVDALYLAATDFPWRLSAARVVILATDDTFIEKGERLGGAAAYSGGQVGSAPTTSQHTSA